jgi:hypothetical protein
MIIALGAAAPNNDVIAWSNFVGDWLTELVLGGYQEHRHAFDLAVYPGAEPRLVLMVGLTVEDVSTCGTHVTWQSAEPRGSIPQLAPHSEGRCVWERL